MTFGMIAPGEITQERLLKTTMEKGYSDLLLILDDITDMMRWQTKLDVSELDDLMAYHLNLSTTMTTHHHLPPPTTPLLSQGRVVVQNGNNGSISDGHGVSCGKSFQERLNKKYQCLYDENYWRDWHIISKPNTASHIAPDMQRIIRTIINDRSAGVISENLLALYQGFSLKFLLFLCIF